MVEKLQIHNLWELHNNMDTLSPNVRGRGRKPNFTNEEIDCLLELVYQNRDILLTNINRAHNMRQKQVVWTQIAADVTLTGDRLCQRDAIDVRQKWKDLLRMAKQDMNAVRTAMNNKDKLPLISPYSNRVMQIKTGTPIFTHPDEDMDMNGGKCFGTDSLMSNGSGDPEGEEPNGENTRCRKPNFSTNEIKNLITLYDEHKSILKCDSNDTATSEEKCDIWKTVAGTLSQDGTQRTAHECLEKWHKFLTQAIKEECVEDEEAKKGCSFPKSQFTDIILKVERTEGPVIDSLAIPDDFWDSLEDTEVAFGNSESRDMGYFNDKHETMPVVKKEPDENDMKDDMKDVANEHDEGESTTIHSSRTPGLAAVLSRPLKRTLSPKVARPDAFRKRKRSLSSFAHTSRHQVLPARTTRTAPEVAVTPNHQKERQELENQQLRLVVEKMELENALLRGQHDKLDLEKEKLRMEIAKLQQEKEKVTLEKELLAMNLQKLSEKSDSQD